MVDVFVGNNIQIDQDVYQLWLGGYSGVYYPSQTCTCTLPKGQLTPQELVMIIDEDLSFSIY